MGEGRGRCGVGQVVGRDVDGLHAGDGALVGGGDALLQATHLGGERGLVTDGAGNAAEKRGDLGARLGEAEDVVHEEENVLLLLVAKVFGHGQRLRATRARAPGGSFIWP